MKKREGGGQTWRECVRSVDECVVGDLFEHGKSVCHSRDEGGKVDPVLRDDVRVLSTVHTGGVRLHVVLEAQFPWSGFRQVWSLTQL